MKASRREFLRSVAASAAAVALSGAASSSGGPTTAPLIDITDLYHPPQDPGDNLDLITAYALPEIDLRAVILDVTDRYRRPHVNAADHRFDDPAGGRDPGFIPVHQLNYLFGRNVPLGVGPFQPMRTRDDPMSDLPPFQESGFELLTRILRESPVPVEIVSFGSARPLAVAYNREPRLLLDKVRHVHLCAGAYPPGFLEWNVQLDVHAFVCILRSKLPVILYPCGTDRDVTSLGQYNTFWKLPDLDFIRRMDPRLQQYAIFAFERAARPDFLAAMDEPVDPYALNRVCARPHNVWETAVWAEVSGRKLVRRDGVCSLVPASSSGPAGEPVHAAIIPARFQVRDDGAIEFERDDSSRSGIFFRKDPAAYERAAREAIPRLYCGVSLR